MKLPDTAHIHRILTEYNFDIGKCIDFFIEEL
jgi:hypothetical protein